MSAVDFERQIAAAYIVMAAETGHRPAADGDLALDDEAAAYARQFGEDEEDRCTLIGGGNFPLRPAMMLSLEAARACCFSDGGGDLVRQLLQLALDSLEASS